MAGSGSVLAGSGSEVAGNGSELTGWLAGWLAASGPELTGSGSELAGSRSKRSTASRIAIENGNEHGKQKVHRVNQCQDNES